MKLFKTLLIPACLAFSAPLIAGAAKDLGRSIDRGMDKIQHALGWDTLTLGMVEQDAAGRPTIERDSNSQNRVERLTSYHKSGNRDTQTVTVLAKGSGRTLYSGKSTWSDKGDLESTHSEDLAYHGDGKQSKGRIVHQQFSLGRLMLETRQKYSPATQSWGEDYKQTLSYYEDGDMKDRLTERPGADKKTLEVWSVKKGALGRSLSLSRWDSSTGSWR